MYKLCKFLSIFTHFIIYIQLFKIALILVLYHPWCYLIPEAVGQKMQVLLVKSRRIVFCFDRIIFFGWMNTPIIIYTRVYVRKAFPGNDSSGTYSPMLTGYFSVLPLIPLTLGFSGKQEMNWTEERFADLVIMMKTAGHEFIFNSHCLTREMSL